MSKNDFTIGSSSAILEADPQKKTAFLKEQIECVRYIKDGIKTWKDLNDLRMQYGFPEVNIDSLRRSFGALMMYDDNYWVSMPSDNSNGAELLARETYEENYQDGTTTSDKVIGLLPDEIHNQDCLLKAHGFDPSIWKIISAKNSKWNQSSGTGTKTLYSSKISVKLKDNGDFSLEDVDEYFDNINKKKFDSLKIEPQQYDKNGEFLEIDVADLHVGLLSYGQETGEDYDVSIARERLEKAMNDIYERCEGKKFKRIVLALLGDIMHVDNQNNTTTKGTLQDVDSRVSKMYDEALDMLLEVILKLGKIAPVEVVGVTGNHSEVLDYCLYKALQMAFRDDKKVTFNISPNPRKWKRYGKVLIGWAHGDMKNPNVTEWIQGEAANDWGQSLFREVHLGHLHSTQTLQKIENSKSGLITRYQPTLVASSAWEHRSGYPKNVKTVMSYLWDEEKGLRSIWYSNI